MSYRYSMTAADAKFSNLCAEMGTSPTARHAAARAVGWAAPPPLIEKYKQAIETRRQQIIADELLELSIAAIRDALTSENERVRADMAKFMWKESRDEFAGAVNGDDHDAADLSGRELQARIEALRAREMTLLHAAAEKAVDVTPDVDIVGQSDPFA
jgi:hypothetical protein